MPKPKPWCNLTGIGEQRDRFLRESLIELKRDLQDLGQDLLVLEGSPELVIPYLVERYGIKEISVSEHPGWEEKQSLAYLAGKLSVPIQIYRGNSLFTESDLPMALDDFPKVFSPFRRKAEKLSIRGPKAAPEQLPPPPSAQFDSVPPSSNKPSPWIADSGGTAGGSQAAKAIYLG
jgi:deoxyribodipyrimidine photo-lyase